MTESKKNIWQLPEEEVAYGITGFAIGRRRKLTRASRRVDDRGCEVRLTHVPSGIEVKDNVPTGHYSRKQMRQAINELREQLWIELENKVAKHRKEIRRKSF